MFALVFFFYDVEFLPAEMYFMEIEYSSELVLYTLLERFFPGLALTAPSWHTAL